VENLCCDIAKEVSFELRRGEILGLFGLVGSGRTEVVEGLIGKKDRQSGKITLEGKEVKNRDPIESKKNGIAYIPSDRKQEGLILIHSVKDNMTVTMIDELGLMTNKKKERQYCDTWINKLGIKTPSRMTPNNSLSGGNQQKVVISKWVMAKPKLLIMDEPTRGVDVGAKAEIHSLMCKFAAEGMAIIMVSSELPEIMGMSDRIMIYHEGRLNGEIFRNDILSGKANQEYILAKEFGEK
jgi:ribose transport system ATP-binding protein/inositol transport system ATP-binding protein